MRRTTNKLAFLALLLCMIVTLVYGTTGTEAQGTPHFIDEPPQPDKDRIVKPHAVLPFIPPKEGAHQLFFPFTTTEVRNAQTSTSEWLNMVNTYRQLAGVPAVTEDPGLSANCYEHARYMAENDHITHHQNPDLPWASPNGEICANKGNAWLGGAFHQPYWTRQHTIDGWMSSPGHRLWLLYPTTSMFGYGFYTAANNRAGAGLDVLSRATFGQDGAYTGWPIRYPAPEQTNIPATSYPITLNWRYFGPTPTVHTVSLTTLDGREIPHTFTTTLPVNHQGVLITPQQPLPRSTTIVVYVTGTYDGQTFTYSWRFTTAAV